MRIGIKCENHSCTIEFMKELLKAYFDKDDVELITKAMGARLDLQYYTDRQVKEEDYKRIINYAPKFHAKCKGTTIKMSDKEINNIRNKIVTINKEITKDKTRRQKL